MRHKDTCYGCGACEYICKHGAISMHKDSEGFTYPSINKELCISCGLCKTICPENNGNHPIQTFAGRIINPDILYRCASGGAFTSIASSFIKQGGVVFAASDKIGQEPTFIKISDVKDLYKVQGSKYFQIELNKSVFNDIKDSLKQTKVLFCGTPCQVAAVKKTFNRFSEKLTTIDLICGGTPSYKLVKQYRRYIEKKHKSTLVEHIFRAKDNPNIHNYQTRLVFSNNQINNIIGLDDEYSRLFASGITLRKSCYNCEFSNDRRMGDITIGDFWGITKHSKFYDRCGYGVSLFICNSLTGVELVNSTDGIETEEVKFEDIKSHNRPLRAKAPKRWERILSLKVMNILPFRIATNIVCYRWLIKKILK